MKECIDKLKEMIKVCELEYNEATLTGEDGKIAYIDGYLDGLEAALEVLQE